MTQCISPLPPPTKPSNGLTPHPPPLLGEPDRKISVFYASPKWHMHPGIPVLSTICCCILVWQLYDSFSTEILRAKYFIDEISRYKLRKLQKMKIMDNFVGWETSLCKKYVAQKHTQKCSDIGNLSIEDEKRRFFIVVHRMGLLVDESAWPVIVRSCQRATWFRKRRKNY